MVSLSGNGGIWGMGPFQNNNFNKRQRRNKKNGNRGDATNNGGATAGNTLRFPVKQAATAATLAFTGDTVAQLRQRWVAKKDTLSDSQDLKDIISTILPEHDWIRALRMTSYGFLLYGPGSYGWYQYLDQCMPKQNVQNLITKVVLNQVILGPSVIAVIFAWNNLWLGKLDELPDKYKIDALPTLLTGFKFWIPVSILNFGYCLEEYFAELSTLPLSISLATKERWKVVPLQARVAFMSMGSIFWNFYLSSTMSK